VLSHPRSVAVRPGRRQWQYADRFDRANAATPQWQQSRSMIFRVLSISEAARAPLHTFRRRSFENIIEELLPRRGSAGHVASAPGRWIPVEVTLTSLAAAQDSAFTMEAQKPALPLAARAPAKAVCPTCHGSGQCRAEQLRSRFPPVPAHQGSRIRTAGQGGLGGGGTAGAAVTCTWHPVKPPPQFDAGGHLLASVR
jgi:hypothetical protein